MKKLNLILAAVAAAALTSPLLTSAASAHSTGERCYFQRVDEDGVVRTRYDRCHHLPSRYRSRPSSGLTLYFGGTDGFYFGRQPRRAGNAYGQEQVCLVTFFNRSQVAAGADANVQRARILPRRQAERIDGPNDRQRIFDYGSNAKTRETCRYLDRLN